MAALAAAATVAPFFIGSAFASAPGAAPAAGKQRVLIVYLGAAQRPAPAVIAAARAVVPTTLRHVFPADNALSISVPAADVAQAVAQLRAQPGVRSVATGVSRTFDAVPSDPGFVNQASYLDPVRAPAAWSSNRGSPEVRIAVVDSGIDVTHPDLTGKVVASYDAGTGSAAITDTVGHGTFVAGVAAADTDNAIGVAGAGYDSSLIGVKVADEHGDISIDDEAAGIRWAANHGADVISLSLGGPDPSRLERRAVDYAQSNGALVVAAAGNGRTEAPQYPAAYPGVVSVGATNPAAGDRAAFSSHGPWVRVAAPGVGIYSTTPPAGSTDFQSSGAYAHDSGTSFAAPLVAGEAALVESKNGTLSAARVRQIIEASARGYRGLGLGAGQVDFARALSLTPPTTIPDDVEANGGSGRLTVTADTSADRVAFQIDANPPLPPVPAPSGTATTSWPSFGYANGAHVLHAYNCSSGGACGVATRSTAFRLDNPPPAIAVPAPSARVTGRFRVRAAAPVGGALRLLVDGRPTGLATHAPWLFRVNGSRLRTGAHTLRLRSCDADATHCAGPLSGAVPVRVAALHPRVVGLTPRRVSPNRDGVHDAAALRYRLPVTQSVQVQVVDAAGDVVRRAFLGPQRAGAHVWTWRPTALPDGPYTVALATRRAGSDRVWRGWGSVPGVIDTRAPRFTTPSGRGSVTYPVFDGFRDSFVTTTRIDEAGRLTLVVRDAHGRVVHRSTTAAGAGTVTLTWDGRGAGGRLLPAGRYHWRLQTTDAAGNSRTSRLLHLRLSRKRLVTITRVLHRPGSTSIDFGGTNPQCTAAAAGASAYPGGLLLTNRCPGQSFDLAYGRYAFHLPPARQYLRLALASAGRARTAPTQLSATVERTDAKLEQPRYLTLRGTAPRTVRLATAPAAGHVTRPGRVFANLLLDSRYPDRNVYDVRSVRLRITFRALRR